MTIQLPPSDQKAAEALIAMGKFASIEEVISEGIRILTDREQVVAKVQIGIGQADLNEFVDHDTVFAKLRSLAAAQDGDAQ